MNQLSVTMMIDSRCYWFCYNDTDVTVYNNIMVVFLTDAPPTYSEAVPPPQPQQQLYQQPPVQQQTVSGMIDICIHYIPIISHIIDLVICTPICAFLNSCTSHINFLIMLPFSSFFLNRGLLMLWSFNNSPLQLCTPLQSDQ